MKNQIKSRAVFSRSGEVRGGLKEGKEGRGSGWNAIGNGIPSFRGLWGAGFVIIAHNC